MPAEAYHLIDCLLQLEPERRLGSSLESIKKLKTHPFFEGVQWDKIS